MKLRSWIRRYLGINALELHMHQQQNQLNSIYDEIIATRNDVTMLFTDEFDEKRKELSNKIGQRALANMIGEDKARKHTTGEL